VQRREAINARRADSLLAVGDLSVTIDGRHLSAAGAGTWVHTLELVAALHRHGGLRVRVVVAEPAPFALETLEAMEGVRLADYHDVVGAGVERDDVVHCPHQVYSTHDIRLFDLLGGRIVVTHQDQLLYRNESYFTTIEQWTWEDFRESSRIALDRAERVVFFSEHARRETLADGLGSARRSVVVPIGVDHQVIGRVAPERPDWIGELGDRPFLLQLGSDLAHKNRPFTIALLRVLREQHGWDGALVLAGPHAEAGSSRDEERRLLAAGDLPVVLAERVGEAERAWLLAHCTAAAYPSADEGFGLIPFEAAAAGRPALFAATGALTEFLPADAPVLVAGDAAASAPAALALLNDPDAAERQVASIRAAAAPLTWQATAERMAAVYADAARARSRRPTGRRRRLSRLRLRPGG
jgi:glycosyltransferase involved in cell wall biosynthesis